MGRPSTGSDARLLAAHLRPERARFAALAGVLVVAMLLPVAGPLLLGHIIDAALDGEPTSALVKFALAYLAVTLTADALQLAITWWSVQLAWRVGNRQADVSVERLTELLPATTRDPRRVVAAAPVFLRHGPPPFAAVAVSEPARRNGDIRLDRLSVKGLTVRHLGGSGLEGVDLAIERGTLTALTGPVGAGKSTLLRALLGLVAMDSGRIEWNGREVDEPSHWLVPPRVAYLPQVPRLFSETLADTVLLGVERAGLDEAIRLASLEEDLVAMPDGLATMVGPKGVRLSGGQIQRTAAARAFLRRPELLVVDDLSSALDVETETRVWDRLLDTPGYRPTLLIVTHRPRVLERADQVVVLAGGVRLS